LEEGQLCVVVGTLYKQMQLKPSILEEYSKEVGFFVNSFLGFFAVKMPSCSGFSCCQYAFLVGLFSSKCFLDLLFVCGILQNMSNEIDFFLYLYTNDSDVGCSLCGKKFIWLR
jgi:hypothetical protein